VISLAWFAVFLFVLCIAGLILCSLVWWLRKTGANRRSPLTRNLLRSPGESIRPQLEDLALDLMGYACMLVMLPFLVYSIWLSELHFSGSQLSARSAGIMAMLTLAALAGIAARLWTIIQRRRSLQLALEGEMAIGQELNQLMLKGYAVYHDFPAEHFNIDHVVVAPAGVFAVETKARPKPISNAGKADAEVVYDGATLRFANRENKEFLEQAAQQAKWLAQWLTSAVGESVSVKPVLALPGWFIKRVARGPVQVISGRDAGYLVRADGQLLSAAFMQRIVHQLDARCRTVEPRAYARVKS
jgi:hypothetical protein